MDYGIEPYKVCGVDVRDPVHLTITTADIPIMIPHELVGGLYSLGWSRFSKVMLGGVSEGQLVRCVWLGGLRCDWRCVRVEWWIGILLSSPVCGAP